jgi:hypothetical protein
MSASAKILAALGLALFASACAPKPAPVAPAEPITVEPTYTGKYK